jgi:outer membrane protein assembly factor BamB
LKRLGGAALPLVWQVDVRGVNCSSPIVAHGLLFFVSDPGHATCLDAKTGRLRWRKRLPGKYYSSPVVAGDRLYFTNLAGHTTVLRAAEEFKVLGENDLEEEVLASPAPVANRLYHRGAQTLFCIQEFQATTALLDPQQAGPPFANSATGSPPEGSPDRR